MCGIAGFAGLGLRPDEGRRWLATMCDRMVHRGPDGQGQFVSADGEVGLGMRRLAVIDVAGGQQPIGNEDGSIQVVFNGEIYNFRALRAELEHAGHRFLTRSDTETIVHGYEEWGEAVVHHLRGMFAIAVWDSGQRQLLLARDRVGIKPLYVWPAGGGLAFASELKCLRGLPGFPNRLHEPALLQFLAYGYVPEPLCAFDGVEKLAPGHVLLWRPGEAPRRSRYWNPMVTEQPDLEASEAEAELRRRLEDAVRCHLESDVPLGAFLSGGIDSTAVVAQMARLMDRPVKTFTIGFEEHDHDEAPHAAQVARALGTDHRELILRPDVDELIDHLILWFDEPFADPSALPTYLVSKLARQHVTVSLSGDGGDELFGGYTRYLEAVRTPPLPKTVLNTIGRLAGRLPHGTFGKAYLTNMSRSPEGRYASTVALPLSVAEGGVVRDQVVGQVYQLEQLMAKLFAPVHQRDFRAQMALVDVVSYLPGAILTKVDRMSMKVSLEARVPLLDHMFVEFALALPSRLKFREGGGKWIFRRAIRDLVPPSVLKKPKQGFGVPLVHWLRGPLGHRLEAIGRPDSPIYQWCDAAPIRRMITEHVRGRRDHSTQLWRLLVLHLWLTSPQP